MTTNHCHCTGTCSLTSSCQNSELIIGSISVADLSLTSCIQMRKKNDEDNFWSWISLVYGKKRKFSKLGDRFFSLLVDEFPINNEHSLQSLSKIKKIKNCLQLMHILCKWSTAIIEHCAGRKIRIRVWAERKVNWIFLGCRGQIFYLSTSTNPWDTSTL